MSGADPTVSVIMAAYNGSAFIRETLESLRAQTFTDFEIVVVDDCSTDDTRALLRAFDDPRLVLIESETNQGPVCARNRAFAAARGRYFAALDQDDLSRPKRLEKEVAYLDANSGVVLVGTASSDLKGTKIRPTRSFPVMPPGLVGWLLQLQNPLIWSSVMFRAEAARRLDPISRPEMLYAEDFDLYHRLRPFGALARIDEDLTVYRRHPGGASQRYQARMVQSATQVLIAAHGSLFGTRAEETATLVAKHILTGQPVNSVALLREMGRIITRLRHYAPRDADNDPATEAVITDTAARLWWNMADAAVRSGGISLAGVRSAKPKDIAMVDGVSTKLIASGVIGRGRAFRSQQGG